MNQATLGQGQQVLRLIESLGLDSEQLQELIAKGFLSDLLKATKAGRLGRVNRGRLYETLHLHIPEPDFRMIVHNLGKFEVPTQLTCDQLLEDGKFDDFPDNLKQRITFGFSTGKRTLYELEIRDRVTPKDLMHVISFISN